MVTSVLEKIPWPKIIALPIRYMYFLYNHADSCSWLYRVVSDYLY